MNQHLSQRAIIVRLSISQWTARKYDRKVSNKIEDDYNTHNSGRWNKILIAREAIQKVQAIASEARVWIYNNTLPWGDNGDRVLLNESFNVADAQLKAFERKFNEAADRFTGEYPSLVEEARQRLNGMFNEQDYPPVSHIRSKFDYRVGYYPVPQANDFRVQLSKNETDKIKEAIEKENSRLLQAANKDLWDRIFEHVSKMAERLSNQKNVFRDSLVENLSGLCKTLRSLNLMKDPDLDAMVERIEIRLAGEDPDTIRENRRIRSEVVKEANQILIDIETMGKRKLNL